MKIKEISQQLSTILASKNTQKQEPTELEFQKLLKDANVKLNHASERMPPSPHDEGVKELSSPALSAASSVSYLLKSEDIAQIRSQSIQATENTLKALEEYKNAMVDPGMPLKKIDPLIQSLSQEMQDLNILSAKLSPSDPLQKILTEVGIVSAVEIEKFRRGEYI
jgi:hypothetical protein